MLKIDVCFDIAKYLKKCKTKKILYYYGGWSDSFFQSWTTSYWYSLDRSELWTTWHMIGFNQFGVIQSETLFTSIKDA